MSLMYLVRSVSSLCHEILDRSGGQPLNTIDNVRSVSPMCLVVLVASRGTSRAPSTRDTTSFLLVCLDILVSRCTCRDISLFNFRSATECHEVYQRDTTYRLLTV